MSTSTLSDIKTATSVAQFIASQIASKVGGVPAQAAVNYLMGEVSWTADTTNLIAKLQNGTATGNDVADVLNKTATTLAAFGVLAGMASPWVLVATGIVSTGLLIYENYPLIAKELYKVRIQWSDLFPIDPPTLPCSAVSPWTQKSVYVGNDGDAYSDPSDVAEGEFKTILVPLTDPIVFNLDGKGIQTAGLSSGVRFDFGGNGVTQNTGWIAPGSGFLVLDRNGNGVIDNGTELFGNNTPLYNAAGKITGYAANGQAALAALDTNHDGVINSLDAGFANLKIWQDTNQDGICQPGELQTLAQLGITGINVGMTAIDPLSSAAALTGGNQLGATGAFTRADGTTGVAADINLTLNPLSHSFSNAIPVIAAAQALPTMQGSGSVRDLNQADSMQTAAGAALLVALTAFNSATTGLAQHAQIDSIVQDWAATSAQQTSIRQAAVQGITLHYYTPTASGGIDPVESASITRMINVMECFGGINFTPSNAIPAGTGDIYVPLADYESTAFQQRYYALQDSIYGALAMQTRLKPYMDSIGLNFTPTGGIQFDFTALNASIATLQTTAPQSALIDMVDLQRYAGAQLNSMGWNAMSHIADTFHMLNGTPQLTAAENLFSTYGLSDWTGTSGLTMLFAPKAGGTVTSNGKTDFIFGGNGNDSLYGGLGSDILVSNSQSTTSTNIYAGDGKEYITGGNGNDTIYGGAGSNVIYAGSGNTTIQLSTNAGETSTIYGGAGSETLYGGAGSNVIHAGSGNTNIQLSSNTSETSTIYGGTGSETIHGGAGADVINAGDGGTANAPTQVFAGSGTPIFQQLTALGTVTFPASELNQVVTGLTSAATISETITRNLNNPNTFDVAFQNAANDSEWRIAV